MRITLKGAYQDGTVAVEMPRFVVPEGGDPQSLLRRLATSAPPPRFSPVGDREARHTVKYAGRWTGVAGHEFGTQWTIRSCTRSSPLRRPM